MAHSKLLSIQSCVSYGHVGNSAVMFPLQRLGTEVLSIHTVMFSNHTGYGSWRGQVFPSSLIEDIFLGLKEREALHDCCMLLTGYMGSKELGLATLNILKQLKQINPSLLYCCDPVIGDIGRGIFVKQGIPEFFKESLLPYANIITPNHFELEYLSDSSFDTLEGAIEAAKKVMQIGPSVVVVTSLRLKERPNSIQVLVVEKVTDDKASNRCYLISTPMLPVVLNGTGDLTAALFSHFYIQSQNVKTSLEKCVARVYSIIEETFKLNSKELALIAAQEQLIIPHHFFNAEDIVT